MKKVYTQREVKEKRRTFVKVLFAGMGASLLLQLIGIFGGGEIFFTASLVVLVSLYVPLGRIVWLALRLKFSEGGMLQVKNGAVIGYFAEPFYCNPRTFAESVFVPFRQEDIVVEKTLHLPVEGRILSCTITCKGRVTNLQRFYNTFLRPERQEDLDLQQEMRVYMAAFFRSQAGRIAALCTQAASTGEDITLAETLIRQDAEKYLQGELSSYGFTVRSATPVCRFGSFIIM